MIECFLVFALAIGLGWPLGLYLARVMRGGPSPLDRAFGPIERALHRAMGVHPGSGMDRKAYARAFLVSNVVLGALVWVLFTTQA